MKISTIFRSLCYISVILLSAVTCSVVHAHESRPIAVNINELSDARYQVDMKMPPTLPLAGLPRLNMPLTCVPIESPLFFRQRSSYIFKAVYDCPEGIAGKVLSVAFPADRASTTTLFRLSLLNGENLTQLLSTAERQWRIPNRASAWEVAKQYVVLGAEHILKGVDHLLFVACLLFIAKTWRRVLATVTGFTAAHSVTLVMSALAIVAPPIAAVEATIALSILFLAHEIAVADKRSWTWRYPIIVSSSFGLLHGFGFASALIEIGLPNSELSIALLSFNVGVELGQVLFILIMLVLWGIARSITQYFDQYELGRKAKRLVVYIIGAAAAFWFLQRLFSF